MLNYLAIGYNGTGGNFVDILIWISRHFSKAAILHFWKGRRVNIPEFESITTV